MATNTPNYGLKKPAQTDFYDVDDFNGNMDILDEELKKSAAFIAKHTHEISDIIGLQDILDKIQAQIQLLIDMIKEGMEDGVTFEADFDTLSNVELIDGQWVQPMSRIEAGSDG